MKLWKGVNGKAVHAQSDQEMKVMFVKYSVQ